MTLLELREVRHGIDETSIEKLCQDEMDPLHKRSVCIARGSAAVAGEDGHVKFTVDPEKWAAKILEDGTVDLRERNVAVSVKADQLLGEVVPATQGQPGMDLSGEEIPTTDGEECKFTAGENVREEREGEVVKFYSQIDGNVQVVGDSIQVNPVFIVNGDVNYEIGNIDAAKDVQVSGSVCSGFSVKAGGTVTVSGMIESGAAVNARGDILVSQGIVGDTTKVVALGNVETKFIQNSAVMAGGDIVVGSYVFSARARAGGRIVVNTGGGDRGGSIVGGEVIATNGIESKLIGSASADRTLVGIGANPEDAARLGKLRKAIELCDSNIVRLMRTLGLQSVDADRIKEMIQKAAPARRQFLIDAVKKLNELVAAREKSWKMQQELRDEVAEILGKAQIKATGKVFADVDIQMGESAVTVSEDIERPLFLMTPDGIRCRPQG